MIVHGILSKMFKIFKRKPKFRAIEMGQGNMLIAHGEYKGAPCVMFCEAPYQGAVGQPAEDMKDYLRNHGVVLYFTTPESADSVVEHMRKAFDLYGVKKENI